MKAAWLERYSKGEIRLTVGERATPRLGAKDVLLRVSVAGVNPLDNMIPCGVDRTRLSPNGLAHRLL